MVEKAPKYRVTFKSGLPKVSLLGDTAPYVNTDVTNPRELYAMLSDSRSHQGALLASVRVNSQAGAKLPPLDTSLQMQFRSLGKHPQHNSYPNLASFRSEPGARADRHPVRRSSSLQDLHTINLRHNGTQTKKLKPILRDNNAKNLHEHGEKASVKFGQKEVHLIRDSPLPPIEGTGRVPSGKGSLSFNAGLQLAQEEKASSWGANRSPRHQRRSGAEFSSEIFPRGQPVEVKKPATPTYDDYPEIYWELRSPTVQDPSDLKEDMIDRDRYRLKQISTLHLKAINRELVASKMDSYRRWQQQMLANSPAVGTASKQDSAGSSVTPTMTGPALSAKNGKQLRMSVPIQNDILAVAATSIQPNTHPDTTKKRTESSKARGLEHGTNAGSYISEDELRRRQKIHAAARGENGTLETEGKPVKATVVNLCIDPDRSSNSPTSDVYNGIKRILFGPRPSSDRARTQTTLHRQEQEDHSQTNVSRPSGSFSAASIHATLGSSQSHRLNRVPSAPTESVVNGSLAQGGDTPDADSGVSSKKILRKFNQLQVFSEKYSSKQNAASMEPWEVVSAKLTPEKGQYLSQSRPPTYKLDLKKLPSGHHHSTGRTGTGEDMGVLAERADGYPFLINEHGAIPRLRNQSPSKSETTSLSFRFRDGEVIVSRQEKKPKVT